MINLRRISLFLTVICLLPVGAARAVLWETLSFEQISYMYEDPQNSAEFSAQGRCVVEYGKDMDFGFLNVSAEIPGLSAGPVWIVRNLPLGDETMGPPDERIGYQFPLSYLGVEPGFPSPDIEFGYTVTPESMSDADMPVFLATTPRIHMAPVMQVQRDVNEGVAVTETEAGAKAGTYAVTEYIPFSGSPGHSVNSWIGCNMPNVPLDRGTDPMDGAACAPASCANSLAWLDTQHPEIDVPDDQRELLRQLSNLMNRERNKGASAKTMARAKLDFIEAHNLPIHVKIQNVHGGDGITSSSGHSTATNGGGDTNGWPTAAWLKSETAKGEDVEICVGYYYKDGTGWHRRGGHAVVVSGTGTVRGWDWIAYKHDAKQSDATGTEEDYGILTETDDGIKIVGMGGSFTPSGSSTPVKLEAYLESVVSESYDATVTQPPAEEDFDDYCDYITRTIKPGGRLDIDFPTDNGRSMDVTVYQVDRNTDPPKQNQLWRWTNNSGRSRGLSNPTNKCITVKIHNDDMDGDYWLWYDDYTVTLSQTKTMTSPDPSNFEETGGFSLGGRDGYCEFGPAVAQPTVVDYMMEMTLDVVPAGLSVVAGTREVFLNCQISVWNKYWTELGLIVDVLDVTTPGDLFVDCLSNGFTAVVPVTGPGRYALQMGQFMEAPDFSLRLEAQNGLELTFDAIGVPTLIDHLSPVGDDAPVRKPFLAANQPNPFNPVTAIRFGLDESGWAELAVYDVQGHKLAVLHEGRLAAGRYERTWAGKDDAGRTVAAGIYVYRLETESGVLVRKMTLVK